MNASSNSAARREREIARTRADILEAAMRAFSRAGFAATTIHDIAKEAGYAAPSLYSYFKSKDDIRAALFQQLAAEVAAAYDAPKGDPRPFAAKVEDVVRRQLELATSRRDVFGLMLGEGAPGGGATCVFDVHLAAATKWLKVQASASDLGGARPEDAACILMGIVGVFLKRALMRGDAPPPPERAGEIARWFLHGVSAGSAGGNGRKR